MHHNRLQDILSIAKSVPTLTTKKERALYILQNHKEIASYIFSADKGDYQSIKDNIWRELKPIKLELPKNK